MYYIMIVCACNSTGGFASTVSCCWHPQRSMLYTSYVLIDHSNVNVIVTTPLVACHAIISRVDSGYPQQIALSPTATTSTLTATIRCV